MRVHVPDTIGDAQHHPLCRAAQEGARGANSELVTPDVHYAQCKMKRMSMGCVADFPTAQANQKAKGAG